MTPITAKEVRHQLAADVLALLPDGWSTYAAPPGNPVAPCLVLAPRAPYRVQGTRCDEAVLLRGTVLMQQAAGTAGLDALDDACTLIRLAINKSTTGAVVNEITDVGPVAAEGEIEYLSATLNITTEV